MKKFLACMALAIVSQTLQADPARAPMDAIWVKVDSVEATDGQINIQGYIEGSTVLHWGIFMGPEKAESHCMRSFYLMMEKPGKYTIQTLHNTCVLNVAK